MYQKLQFRRQFLLTKAPMTPLANWQCLQINRYYLYAHPDLEVNRVTDTKKIIVLIGNIYDSAEPQKRNADILKDIIACTCSMEGLVSWKKRYAGRYALLYIDDKDAFIMHDARGLREIYYCTKDNWVVCGSQPNLVAKYSVPEVKPTSDPDLLDFYRNHLKNSAWIGNETYYEGVKHLLPNHYININRREAYRYWPNESIKRLDLNEAVSKSCTFVQGILKAMAHRHSVMMAVTAGVDSRVLLAMSRAIQHRIYYFINNEGLGYRHPDISVPKKIFKRIGVPFHVHELPTNVDNEFKRIFLTNAFFATDRILPTIYNYFKSHDEKVNILGLGEIGRDYYGTKPRNWNYYRMAYKLGYKESRYVIRQCKQIIAEMLQIKRKFGINVATMLYWEQRAGNWGAVGNSESDIAIEEVDPFDSHLFYEMFLGVDDKYTKYKNSIFFKKMIQRMWPELLECPINPPDMLRDKFAWFLNELGLFELLKEFKYQLSYVRHICRARLL